MKGAKNDLNPVALLDRSKCFEVVAAAVKTIVSDSVVDLTCPEVQFSLLIPFLRCVGGKVGGLSSRSKWIRAKICKLLVFQVRLQKGITSLFILLF